jgi:hypothetical protein
VIRAHLPPNGSTELYDVLGVDRKLRPAAQGFAALRRSSPASRPAAAGAAMRRGAWARSHRVVNSVTAQRHTFAQPQDGSSTLHLWAMARAVMITAAQFSEERDVPRNAC